MSKRHPPSEYGSKYPFNRATVTESGHEVHLDDTPGKERIRIAHRSGSYTETGPDGRRVDMTVAQHVQYVKGGLTVTVDKNADEKVGGSRRTNVDGDSHVEVGGTSSQAVGLDQILTVGGDMVSAVGGDSVTGVVGNQVLKIGGGLEMKVDSSGALVVSGPLVIEAGGGIVLKVGGSTIEIGQDGIKLTATRIDLN